MNDYAHLARERHRMARPAQHALIEDPAGFFERVGAELEAELTSMRAQLLGSMTPGESPEDYRRRGEQCQAMALELTLSEHFLFQPERPGEDDDFTDEELASDPALAQHLEELAMIDDAIVAFYRPEDP